MADPLYDIAVIGAGPAGATVARVAAERGLHVLLVDKKQELGAPIQCSGAVSASALHDAGVAPHDEFVLEPVYGFVVYDAMGQETRLDYRAMQPADHAAQAIGYVVDRRRFDRHLVMLAERAGVEVWLKTEGTGFEALGDGTVALGLNRLGHVREVRARVIVGADGLQSQVGKWAGLRTHIRLPELASCLQVVVDGVETDGVLEIVTGRPWAPGGYAWVFPKGHGYAEVGLGVIRTRTEYDARWHLDRFMQDSFLAERFRDARVLEVQGGGVPLAAPLKQPYADHVILVGDAARHVNPITGGGIHTALRGGVLAAEFLADFVPTGAVPTAEALAEYHTRWLNAFGRMMWELYRVKTAIFRRDRPPERQDADLYQTLSAYFRPDSPYRKV